MEAQYRYKPIPYFILAFVLTWVPWAFAIALSKTDPKATFGHALNFVGLVGPLLATIVFIYGARHAPLRRDFHQRLVDFRLLSWPHVLLTLVMVPLVTFFSIWLSIFIDQPIDQFKIVEGALAWLPIILLAPLLEELAWRGYAVDSLRSRFGMLGTALLFGALWALWHLPLFLMKGTYHADLIDLGPLYVANFFVSVVVIAVVANWLYYRHRRFIVAGIYFHFLINTVAIVVEANHITKCLVTVVYAVIAVIIVRYDRELFREGPRTLVEGTS